MTSDADMTPEEIRELIQSKMDTLTPAERAMQDQRVAAVNVAVDGLLAGPPPQGDTAVFGILDMTCRLANASCSLVEDVGIVEPDDSDVVEAMAALASEVLRRALVARERVHE